MNDNELELELARQAVQAFVAPMGREDCERELATLLHDHINDRAFCMMLLVVQLNYRKEHGIQ